MANSDDETPDEGLEGAHTRGDPARDPDLVRDQVRDRERDDVLAASVQAIAAHLEEPDGDQLDLLTGSPDLDDESTGLARIANKAASGRRGRGRPQGSSNKRNTAVFDYLEQLGHRDPAVTLSMLQSADTVELAQALGLDSPKGRQAVLAIQRQAAADLMPYKYAKRPTVVELPGGGRVQPVMVIGEFNVSTGSGDVVMSVDGGAKKPNENKGRSVRHDGTKSHDVEDSNDINTIDHESS